MDDSRAGFSTFVHVHGGRQDPRRGGGGDKWKIVVAGTGCGGSTSVIYKQIINRTIGGLQSRPLGNYDVLDHRERDAGRSFTYSEGHKTALSVDDLGLEVSAQRTPGL